MSPKYALTIIAVLILLCLMGGCAKTGTGPAFHWSYGEYTTADSSFSPSSTPANSEILAYAPEQVLAIFAGTKLAVGSYTLHGGSVTPYLYFYSSGVTEYSKSGTLTISSNDNTKMAGSFSVTFGDNSQMTGSFSDVPIR